MLNAIQAAVERASPTYIPLTRSVHSQALLGEGSGNGGIPPGPYHPGHEAYLTSDGLPTAR